MRKTIVTFLSAILLLTSCVSVPRRMESSTVLLKMKVHVVRVTKSGKKLERSGWGTCSGVYIKKNTILTAAHCIDVDAEDGITLKEIWVKSDEGSERAVVIKKDSAADLALLYTPLSGTPVRFAFRAIRGEDCWVIGNPLGLVNIITKGIVSQVNMAQQGEKATFFIVDAVVLPGNSGGAVVDSHGHLIGILTRSTSLFGPLGASGLGIAVDLHTIREFLSSK